MTIAQVEAAPVNLFGHFTVNDNGVPRTYTNKTKLLQDLCELYKQQYGQAIYIEGIPEREPANETSEELFFEEDDEPEPKKKGAAHRTKPIVAIKDGKEIPFKSSAEAARELKIDRTNIPHALSGRYRHVAGYQFKYA